MGVGAGWRQEMMDLLQIGGFRIDFDRELVIRPDGVDVRLRPQAFAVLRHLALNAGRIVGKDELVGAVWPGIAVTDDSLVQCVAEIRRAFGAAGHAISAPCPSAATCSRRPPTRLPPITGAHRRTLPSTSDHRLRSSPFARSAASR